MNVTLDRVRAEVAGLKAWVVANIWTKAQVSGWTTTNFFRIVSHQSVSKGAASARMPIILDANGKIDSSFIAAIGIVDNNFVLVDDLDVSKRMKFQLSGITASTTRTMTIPDADITIAGRDNAETFTNKTLTTPTIASLTNAQHNHDDAAGGGVLTSYMLVNGTSVVSGSAHTNRYQADVDTLTDVQGLRVDVTFVSSNIRSFSTRCQITLQRNGNVNDHCIAVFNALWSSQGSGAAAALRIWDAVAGMSGTPTNIGVTAITNGIRMTLDSTDFGASGGLDTNMVVVETIGTNASVLTHTVTVF